MDIKKRHKIFILELIFIMVIQAIRYFPFKFGGWSQIQLSFSYRYGFIQRAFMGTVLDIISTVFHIPWKYMRYIHGITLVGLFTVLMLVIVYKSLEYAKDDVTAAFLSGLALVFFMGPGWNTNYSNFALLELWHPIISILAMYFIIKERHLWAVPILSTICVLIHPVYVFLYFNLVLVAFFYKIFISPSKNRTKHVISCVISFLIVSILFVYLHFYSHVKDGITLDYVMDRVAEFTSKSLDSLEIGRYNVAGFIFRTREGISESTLAIAGNHTLYFIQEYWLILLMAIVMYLPFIFEVFRYWKYVVKEANLLGKKGFLYGLLPFGIVTVIPAYILLNDYGRWTYAVFFYEFAIIWFINILNDKCAENATLKMYSQISSHRIYYIILLFHATVLGAMEQNLISPLVSTLETYAWKVLALFGIS